MRNRNNPHAANTPETFTDWTAALITWGDARDWKRLGGRGMLKLFCSESVIARQTGFQADSAFRIGYNALAAATPEQRSFCQTWADVKTLQKDQEQARLDQFEAARNRRLGYCLAQKDQDGWLLLAGEDTAIVGRGTLDQTLANLPLVTNQKRDRFSNRGAWQLLAPDGTMYLNGQFDDSLYW